MCLSEAKGMDIKMSEDKIIKIIDELYEKYGVERIFYSDMGTEQIIRGMKGILANLDLNKQKSYTKEYAELIKDIYFMYCWKYKKIFSIRSATSKGGCRQILCKLGQLQ